MSRLNSFVVLAAALLYNIALIELTDVTIKQGKLKGVTLKSRNGTDYYAFYGIPFAKPPVGELRFKPPEEPDSWSDIRNATSKPPICVQRNVFVKVGTVREIQGQEDCLYLNVFTPANMPQRLLPVIVQIHGGAFIIGSAKFTDPMYFMDYPVIMVTVQYRLGIIGFLSAGDDELPGNYGLKDQVAALKWVRQNIKAFGGDPNSVTIMGQSAGAGSTHLHMYSPLSKGLFHRSISQSGSALAPWAQTSSQLARAKFFAVGVLTGCSTKSTKVLVDCLKKLPAKTLIDAHDKLYVWDVQPNILFPPVVEPKSVEGAFLTDNPWSIDVVNLVPWVAGICSAEGGVIGTRYFDDSTLIAELNKYYERLFPLIFYYGYWMENKNLSHVSQALRQSYFGNEEISVKNPKKLIDLFTDGYFAVSSLEAAQRYKGKLYFYYYDHRNVRTFNENFGNFKGEDLGVCHGDDSISLFPLSFFPQVTDGPDFAVSKRMVNYWVNFVTSGNPNGGTENIWQAVQSKAIEYLHITTQKDVMEKNLLEERRNLWVRLLGDSSKTSQSSD